MSAPQEPAGDLPTTQEAVEEKVQPANPAFQPNLGAAPAAVAPASPGSARLGSLNQAGPGERGE
jgi:hypothetical protein